ncbi:MAG: YlxR family protein [Actinobacteria bacterium]|nr:MAG: YlxR family protein [Actinomycetota bacterium]
MTRHLRASRSRRTVPALREYTVMAAPSLAPFGVGTDRSGSVATRVNRAASSATSQAKSRRTCAGCGRKAPQAELIRFVAHEASLTPAAGAPGRGVYTCRRLACFERARARAAFNRVLRQTVRVDPALARLYTDADG